MSRVGPHRRRSLGMTLIEVLVVMAIVGLMLVTLSIGFGAAGQAGIIRSTNQLASTIRFAYDRARFTGSYYRIHIDFEKRTFTLQQADEAMYLPATNRDGEIREVSEQDLEEQADRDKRAEEAYNRSLLSQVFDQTDDVDIGDEEIDPYAAAPKRINRRKPPLFSSFDGENLLSDLGKAVTFPESVKIVSVRTESDLEPITEGEASIYFFPQGRTQMAHIQLNDEEGDNPYTIIVQPLTGKVEVKAELVDLELPDEIDAGRDDQGNERERRSF